VPREEVEAIIKAREALFGQMIRFSFFADIIEKALFALSGRFDEGVLAASQGIQRASNDLARLIWEMGTDLAKLTDMEILECATTHRRAYAKAGVVIKDKLTGTIDGGRAERLDCIRQLIVGELNALEQVLSVFSGMGYDTASGAWLEETRVKEEYTDKG
jgi:hypothetical protein